jgi:hypothetical protein
MPCYLAPLTKMREDFKVFELELLALRELGPL